MKLRPLGLLLGAVLLTHLPLLRAGYVQDDHVAVEAAHGSSGILTASYWEGLKGGDRSLWRPVTVATYAAERAVFGRPIPSVSHTINLLLHAAVCGLIYAIARAWGLSEIAALLGALLFAVTPAKSEAVANVVGRAELLAALFTLAAVRLALARPSRAAAWGAGLAVLLACSAKETGFASFPLVAIAVLVAEPRSRPREIAGMLLPTLLAVVVVAIARTHALEAFFPPQTIPVMDNPLVAEGVAHRLATALALVGRYAAIALFPWRLSNDYAGASVPIERGLLGWRPLVGAAILVAGVALAARGRRWALVVAIVLLPYLLVGNLLVPVGAIMAERFLYLPAAGLALLAASATDRWKPARTAASVTVAILAVLMFARAIDWRSDATIFAATARNNPKSPRAPYWLGSIAGDEGNTDAALREFDAAIRNWPAFAPPWLDRGLVLARRGALDEARSAFAETVRLDPSWADAHLDLALALHRAGDRASALKSARKAALADPADAKAWAEVGHLFFETGDFGGAASAYRRAVDLGRSDLTGRLREAESRRGSRADP